MADHQENLYLASRFFSRCKGLLFTEPSACMLLLTPCKSIHTFGMGYAIDVAFLDAAGKVLEVHRDVPPRRLVKNRKAHSALERASRPLDPWLTVGEQVGLKSERGWL